MIPANALKDGLVALKSMNGRNCKQLILDIDKQKLTAVLPSGSLNIKPTFYMSEKNFIEMEQERFENNPYILKRLPADSDNSNNNTTIGIELLYKEKITGENLKEDTLAVAWLIHHLKTVQDRLPYNPPIMQPNYNRMEFDGSKINGAIPLVRNIDDDNNLNLRINSIPDKIDVGNMSSLIEDMLVVLDEIKSENEITELTRRRNARRYAYFYELYKMILETVASEPKKFGETNALKVKKKLEGEKKETEEETELEKFLKKAEEKLTQRQWRSYKTSAERINRLWNTCNKSFAIFDLITVLTPNLFERLPSKESAERWFTIIEKGIYYTHQEYKDIQKQQEEEKEVIDDSS
ncbi:hypothetical protein RhiirA1_481048, partial [Rhizophagus irregularis]